MCNNAMKENSESQKKVLEDYKVIREMTASLVEDNLMFFAYIKCYIDDGRAYALVAGKSGSYTVNNSSSCDLGFYLYPQKCPAKNGYTIMGNSGIKQNF